MSFYISSSCLSTMAIAMTTLLFLFFTSSSATDMSIIDFNNKQTQESSGLRSDAEVMAIYKWWLAKHQKAYNGLGETERRFEIFKDNLRFIDEHNAENRTYKVGLNRFADLTNEEYRSMYLGTRTDAKRRFTKSKNVSQRYAYQAGEKLPESVDWRVKGAVNSVKDQGSCVCATPRVHDTYGSKPFMYSRVNTRTVLIHPSHPERFATEHFHT